MEQQENRDIPISIIIPVYNVYEWLDQCLESVVTQTFPDFEIILINDGSTDGSDKKCLEWKKRDNRIRYIGKENEGVFVTRNLGLKEAQGKYIIFIDSDDWLDLCYVEKMYNMAVKTDADIVECDYWRFNNNTGKKTYRSCYGHMGKEYSLEEHIIYGVSMLWKCMFKKSVWIENEIVIPNCLGSAQVVYVLLLTLGAKIVNVHEPLYYYRRLRKGSILDINGQGSTEEGKMGLQELDVLIAEFLNRNLYKDYEEILERTVKYRLSDLLAAQFTRKPQEQFELQYNNYYKYIENRFPDKGNDRYFTIGGYNLNRILSYLPEIHNPYYRFNFSSIISIMHPVREIATYGYTNEYRKKMIERDVASTFWNIFKESRPKYLFLDLIEERFDVIEYQGGYLTKSDAFEGAEIKIENVNVIPRESEKCKNLWKESFRQFVERLRAQFPLITVVLIKNYLSEKVGDVHSQKYHENLDEIRKVNDILREYYSFAEDDCDKVIEASECNYYFTDRQYEYGAVPSHLNEIVNKEIAKKIEERLL